MPEFNFSIAFPDSHSRWYAMPIQDIKGRKARAFVFDFNSLLDTFVLVVWDMGGKMDLNSTKQIIEKFIYGMQMPPPKDAEGFTVEILPSTIPTSDSIRYKVAVNMRGDYVSYRYGYVVPAERNFLIYTYTTAATEPENFRQFVSSFELITPHTNALTNASTPSYIACAILLILSIVGAIVDARYRAKGGDKPTSRDQLYLLIAALISLSLIIASALYAVSAENLGRITSLLMILLFAGWEIGRWNIRRKHPLLNGKRMPWSDPHS